MYSQENGKCHVQFEPSGGFVTDAVSLLHSETGKREFVVETGNSGFIVQTFSERKTESERNC